MDALSDKELIAAATKLFWLKSSGSDCQKQYQAHVDEVHKRHLEAMLEESLTDGPDDDYQLTE